KNIYKTHDVINDFFKYIYIFGIKTDYQPYQVAQFLNQCLYISLHFHKNIECQLDVHSIDINSNKWQQEISYVANSGQAFQISYFEMYKYIAKDLSLSFFLYQNGFQNKYLITELKSMNYLFAIRGENFNNENIKEVIKSTQNQSLLWQLFKLPIKSWQRAKYLIPDDISF
ncbi:MAG: hypothetical protein ORN85_00790, partial [Sediminibacterium sp.]|nr:hypothetical protein [Sediminibacterium sp.]